MVYAELINTEEQSEEIIMNVVFQIQNTEDFLLSSLYQHKWWIFQTDSFVLNPKTYKNMTKISVYKLEYLVNKVRMEKSYFMFYLQSLKYMTLNFSPQVTKIIVLFLNISGHKYLLIYQIWGAGGLPFNLPAWIYRVKVGL